jgi:hypothetical protein
MPSTTTTTGALLRGRRRNSGPTKEQELRQRRDAFALDLLPCCWNCTVSACARTPGSRRS